jgi:hypothetical protein
LLGGKNEKLLAYCSTGEIHGLEQRVEDVLRIRDEGFRAVKLRFHNPDWRVELGVVPASGPHRRPVGPEDRARRGEGAGTL